MTTTERTDGYELPTPDVAHYLERGGDACPICGGDVEGDSVDIEQAQAAQDCCCQECGATWRAMYALVGFFDSRGTFHGPAVIDKDRLYDRLSGWLHQLATDSDLDIVTAPHKYRSMAADMRSLMEQLEGGDQ